MGNRAIGLKGRAVTPNTYGALGSPGRRRNYNLRSKSKPAWQWCPLLEIPHGDPMAEVMVEDVAAMLLISVASKYRCWPSSFTLNVAEFCSGDARVQTSDLPDRRCQDHQSELLSETLVVRLVRVCPLIRRPGRSPLNLRPVLAPQPPVTNCLRLLSSR